MDIRSRLREVNTQLRSIVDSPCDNMVSDVASTGHALEDEIYPELMRYDDEVLRSIAIQIRAYGRELKRLALR